MTIKRIKQHQLIDKARLGDLQALEEIIDKYKYIALKRAKEYGTNEEFLDKLLLEEKKLVETFLKEETDYQLSGYLYRFLRRIHPLDYSRKKTIEDINQKTKQGDQIAKEKLIENCKKQVMTCTNKIYDDIYNYYYKLEIEKYNKLQDFSYLDDNYEFKFPDFQLSKEDIMQDVTLKALELLERFILNTDTYFSVYLSNNLNVYRKKYVERFIKNNDLSSCQNYKFFEEDCGGLDENLEEKIMITTVLKQIDFTESQKNVINMALNKVDYKSIIELTKITTRWGVDSCIDLSAEKIRRKIFK